MELRDALRATGAVRKFTNEPVTDDVLYDILDDARFAPSGGNRQAWHCIVVANPQKRRALRDLYLDGWHDYISHTLAGLVPFSPTATPQDREAARTQRAAAEALSNPDGFPERLDEVPALIVVTADLSMLAAVDRDLGRYTLAGGASIYPFVWQILLAAKDRGLGGVITTMATRHESDVQTLLAIPPQHAIAAVVALGHPVSAARRLRRHRVEEFTTRDVFNGAPFSSAGD